MITICIVHNNESDRLAYLRPLVLQLKNAFLDQEMHCETQEIGPEKSGMANLVASNKTSNIFKRAFQWTVVQDRDISENPRFSNFKTVRRFFGFFSNLSKNYFGYHRSIRIEQEVLFAHAHAWQLALKNQGMTLIFESDIVFNYSSVAQLVEVTKRFEYNERPLYFDLAGGCNTSDILRSWCFEEVHGCETSMQGKTKMFKLPLFVGNTVAGYLINKHAAEYFCQKMKDPPMLAPDWALMSWALKQNQEFDCYHTLPTILQHGSVVGAYNSSIENAIS
jgi:hypothetical protein